VTEKLIDQVTDHVYLIDMEGMNVYLIALPESLTLIDTSFPGTSARIFEAVRSIGRDTAEIRDILVTHCHPDHAGGLAELRQATGATAWMHPDDAQLAREGEAFRPYETSPGLKHQLFAAEVIEHGPATYEPATVDMEVKPGETISVAGGIKAVGTPGHTAGHLVFLWEGDGGVLFVGDAANNVEGLDVSPIYESVDRGLEDLRGLGDLEFDTACFAHGAPILGGAAQEFRKKWGKR
jgi:glyoxylase-like metal-dependent hydrolase (beta-lactamase superfamily II)